MFLKRTLVETHSVRLVIWDISGSALSSSLLDKYLHGAHVSLCEYFFHSLDNLIVSKIYSLKFQAVLLTFDITNSTSFVALPAWYNAVLNIASTANVPRPLISVIANKCRYLSCLFHLISINVRLLHLSTLSGDIEHQRAVPMDKQSKFVNENRLFQHSVSTRTGENVSITPVYILLSKFSLGLIFSL